MAGSQGSVLAIAVSNAGGLGSLPCAMLTPQAIRAELSTIAAATGKPYNVNFFVHREPAVDDAREAAAAPAFPLASGAITPLRAKAEAQGSGDFTGMWAGQHIRLGTDPPAAQLTRELGGLA